MKPIEIMHQIFGSGHPSDKCGNCKNFTGYTANRTWYKCRIYGETRSEASDWRRKWNACAMFNMPYNGMPIIEVKKHMPKPVMDEQIEGQMSIFDMEGGNNDH